MDSLTSSNFVIKHWSGLKRLKCVVFECSEQRFALQVGWTRCLFRALAPQAPDKWRGATQQMKSNHIIAVKVLFSNCFLAEIRGKRFSNGKTHHENSFARKKKGFVIATKSFVKIGITKIFCYNNKMFGSINKTFGCCGKIFGCSNKNFICCS